MELRTVNGLHLVLFAPSELGVYAKPVTGGFAPISPMTVLQDSGAQAAINGNMFDTCAGQDLPSDNAGHYRQSVCDVPEYMIRDGSLSAPGIYPTRGATISVVDGTAVVRRGADAPSSAKVAIQGYPALVLEGQRQDTAHSGSNIERVYRSMLARMNDGQLALIAGVGTMDSIADAAIAANARDVIYLDGGGSTWVQTTEGGSYGASERRPVPSWVVVRKSAGSLGGPLAAGAAVALGLWLFWPGPGIARSNPDEEFRPLATRIANAEERFIANVMERGFTRDEALKIMAVYRKLKIVKMDANGATLSVKHGAYWEPDVLRRALESACRA